ncbi:MAG TPA: hypothetical protein VME22_18500 [Solirubrobacteraceae bacterium]|nr:hypothetical protein [Solirubrobacteraceae bacterium]
MRGKEPDLTQLPSEYYDEQIRKGEQLVQSLRQQLAAATQELDWWKMGRQLFATKGSHDTGEDDDEYERVHEQLVPGSQLRESVPDLVVLQARGVRPTHRQAVLRVMLDAPAKREWRAVEIIAALREHDLMPDSDLWGDNIIRQSIRNLAARGELVRTGYGTYALAPGTQGVS